VKNRSAALVGPTSRSPEPDFWHLEKINVKALRDRGLSGTGVAVGILDSGIQASHPEFAGKKIHFAHFDRDGNQTDLAAKDFGYHGTHVAGLIAGRNAGVAPDATIAVAAVLTEKRGYACHHAAILAGLDWLIKTDFLDNPDEPGCAVINSSLQIKGFNDFLYGFLATASVAPGSLVIAAGGNFGTVNPGQPTTPGNYDIVVGVGATDADDRVALFSQWGVIEALGGIAKPDLCAPGVDIWSSVPNDRYLKMSGTSMASPLVCGAAALLIQQDPALAHDARSLKEALLRHSLPLPAEGPKAGRGRLRLGGVGVGCERGG
jgi:serine protease AprX